MILDGIRADGAIGRGAAVGLGVPRAYLRLVEAVAVPRARGLGCGRDSDHAAARRALHATHRLPQLLWVHIAHLRLSRLGLAALALLAVRERPAAAAEHPRLPQRSVEVRNARHRRVAAKKWLSAG
eukprot:scaffold17932_cov58-Phaeocystis_antarctica.AAC.7